MLGKGRELYRALPAMTRDLGLHGPIRRTAPFIRLSWQVRVTEDSLQPGSSRDNLFMYIHVVVTMLGFIANNLAFIALLEQTVFILKKQIESSCLSEYHCNIQCSMTISAEHRSEFAALHPSWWRLHISEKFPCWTKNHKQTKHLRYSFPFKSIEVDLSPLTCEDVYRKANYMEVSQKNLTTNLDSLPHSRILL